VCVCVCVCDEVKCQRPLSGGTNNSAAEIPFNSKKSVEHMKRLRRVMNVKRH